MVITDLPVSTEHPEEAEEPICQPRTRDQLPYPSAPHSLGGTLTNASPLIPYPKKENGQKTLLARRKLPIKGK